MEYRTLCKNGPKISVLGLGAWPIGGGMGKVDENTAVSTIHAAIDNGITTIDTAQYYRKSESIIGKALKNGYRSRCFIATKASYNFSKKGIISAMENSLRALRTDYVDLYMIHNWNPKYPIEESMETMIRLREQGKTRYIGVSNFNKEEMKQVLNTARFESNQLRYNMFDRQIEQLVISFCE
jgi:aryl-alcohol dehydrogenase-like predicted oxidoreductase